MEKMNSPIQRSIRIILAITSKDIVDALKNKNTLTALITVLFLIVVYKFLPTLSREEIPFVFLYDAGQSGYTERIEESELVNVRTYQSFEEFSIRFRDHADAEIGLVLPADFDQTLNESESPQIQGYVLHWVSQELVEQQKNDLQERITEIVGTPVKISMEGGTITMSPDSSGGFMASAGMVIIVLMLGMVLIPHLMLEEKSTRTMDALLVSPANSTQIVIGKAFTGLFYASIFIILAILLNVSLILQWWLAILTVFLWALVCISLGLLLGTLIENRQQLIVVANIIMFPLFLPIFLSIMTDLLPGWLITIMNWLPPVVTSDLIRISFSNQQVLGEILPRLILLTIFLVVLLTWEISAIRRLDRK